MKNGVTKEMAKGLINKSKTMDFAKKVTPVKSKSITKRPK